MRERERERERRDLPWPEVACVLLVYCLWLVQTLTRIASLFAFVLA